MISLCLPQCRCITSQLLSVVPVLLSELCVRSLHHGEDMVRGKCLFSGLIIQCFFNGLLLVGLGTHDEYAAEAEQDYHVRPPLQAGCASRKGCRSPGVCFGWAAGRVIRQGAGKHLKRHNTSGHILSVRETSFAGWSPAIIS